MTDVVVDASVVLRRLTGDSAAAEAVLRREGLAAPSVIVAEVLNGLAKLVRFADIPESTALGLYADFRQLPIERVPDEVLAEETLAIAGHLRLSAYDASYVALAARLRAPLVTADRPLAAAYPNAELID